MIDWSYVVEQNDDSGTGRTNVRIQRSTSASFISFDNVLTLSTLIHDVRATHGSVFRDTVDSDGTYYYRLAVQRATPTGGACSLVYGSINVLEIKR